MEGIDIEPFHFDPVTWQWVQYDEIRQCVVIFGGTVESEYDGCAW